MLVPCQLSMLNLCRNKCLGVWDMEGSFWQSNHCIVELHVWLHLVLCPYWQTSSNESVVYISFLCSIWLRLICEFKELSILNLIKKAVSGTYTHPVIFTLLIALLFPCSHGVSFHEWIPAFSGNNNRVCYYMCGYEKEKMCTSISQSQKFVNDLHSWHCHRKQGNTAD